LSDVGIDSIAVSKCQHSSIIQCLLVDGDTLNVKNRGIEPFG
jgi:hypothetical protein